MQIRKSRGGGRYLYKDMLLFSLWQNYSCLAKFASSGFKIGYGL